MQITESTVFHLKPDSLEATTFLPGAILDAKVRYNDHPDLRERVQDLVGDLVATRSVTWFSHLCGRCGSSCRRPDVLVREADVLPMAQRLGLSPQAFRERHLDPAPTWNPGDGVLRLVDGACPFLDPGQGPGTAACRVYEDRPQGCRAFLPGSSICRKDPSLLLEEVAALRVSRGTVQVRLKGFPEWPPEPAQGLWEGLAEALGPVEAEASDRYRGTLERTRTLIQGILDEFPAGGTMEDHRRRLESLRELMHRLSEAAMHRAQESGPLEEVWALFRHLEDRVHGRAQVPEVAGPEEARPPGAPRRVRRIALGEGGLMAAVESPEGTGTAAFAYAEHPALQQAARAVLYQVLSRPDEDLQAALASPDPPCFMCGECCRVYAVEITRHDSNRLASHLGIPREEFEERYTEPGRFSWNRGHRILRKEPREGERKACVFLEHREDGFFYCGVHSHKPEVCRRYSARNALCRRTNQLAHWGRQAGSLLRVEVDPDEVTAVLWREASEGRPPRRFPRASWPGLDRASQALEAAAERALDGPS